jgi:hypothetical protein
MQCPMSYCRDGEPTKCSNHCAWWRKEAHDHVANFCSHCALLAAVCTIAANTTLARDGIIGAIVDHAQTVTGE